MNLNKPEQLEEEHVHKVYDKIADHFSNTRYKPWPVIKQFLEERAGTLVADVGCGNGKYLSVAQNSFSIGSDYSKRLVQIAQEKNLCRADALVADAMEVPYRDGVFDHVISIAVIHHISTRERRLMAVRELLRIVKKGGNVLVYVWALEQTVESRRQFKEGEQDCFVSWKLAGKDSKDSAENDSKIFQRFYHVFRRGELEELVSEAEYPCRIVTSGYDKDNHYVILEKL